VAEDDLARLGEVVLSDLTHLMETWSASDVDDNTLRRDSVILRKLLIDSGGLLRRYLRLSGYRGEPKIMAPDWAPQLEGLDSSRIVLAAAGGTEVRGMHIQGVLVYTGALSPEAIQARYEAQKGRTERVPRTLSRYINDACMITEGTKVTRHLLILYVANKLGGAHFDTRRERDNPQKRKVFEALDKLLGTVSLSDKEAIYHELMAIGQAFDQSPDIREIVGI
jgi:hypothetical protein